MINLASFCAYPSGAPTGPPAALGHIEAMLVLPQHLLARHLAHLMHHIRTSASAAPLPMRAGADFIAHSLPSAQGSFGVDMNTLAVAILTSTARQHAHGWALLAALTGMCVCVCVSIPLTERALLRVDCVSCLQARVMRAFLCESHLPAPTLFLPPTTPLSTAIQLHPHRSFCNLNILNLFHALIFMFKSWLNSYHPKD